MLSNDTKRDGLAVATLRTDNAVANLYIGFVFDNLPTFMNLSKTRPDISFTLNPLQVSFARAPDEPVEFDPSVSKYLFIKVCVSDALLTVTKEVMLSPRFVLLVCLSVGMITKL